MRIRTPADLGVLIRNTRKKLRLNQSTLAKMIGVSRLDALRISLNATTPETKDRKYPDSPVDIDRIVAAARNPCK
jgi:HTH-type transcriptional regulator/antitoxin HipB